MKKICTKNDKNEFPSPFVLNTVKELNKNVCNMIGSNDETSK